MTRGPEIDLFEAAAAREARDAGIERITATAGHWTRAARLSVRAIPYGWTGLGEDIRFKLIRDGLPQPHHPNAWGALIKWAVDRGLFEATGEVRNTRDRPSHACYTKVYRRTGAQ